MTVKTTPNVASQLALNADNVDATEHTPLLTGSPAVDADGTGAVDNGSPGGQAGKKPLPKMQMFLLCYARMMEPIAFFFLFPFIGEMVQKNGNLPESDIGFYSGLIESLFSFTGMLVMIFWGRLADIVGRKPILIYSLVGMSVTPVLFCLSTSLWQMMLFRCIAGVFSGSNLIIRTMIAENSTPDTQAVAFSWFSFGGNIGLFLGPILGGVLANPVDQYPKLFKGIAFLERYPYALPGFIIGGISATSAILCGIYLKETLDKDKDKTPAPTNGEPVSHPAAQMSIMEIIKSPGVGFVLWLYSHVMTLAFTFTAIMPIALYTSVDLGGFGFSSNRISIWMSIQGASQALWLLIAFPWLHRRLGNRGVINVCSAAYPFFFALYMVLNLLLRAHTEAATASFWALASFTAIIGPGVAMAFTGVQLAINDSAPTTHVLGTLNAIALTASAAIRTVGPGVSTAIYAVGVRNQILGGQLAWVLLIPLAVIFTIGSHWLPDDKKLRSGNNDTEEGDA